MNEQYLAYLDRHRAFVLEVRQYEARALPYLGRDGAPVVRMCRLRAL